MNDELQNVSKKRPWLNLRYYPSTCLEGLRNTTKIVKVAGLLPEFRKQDLLNMKQKWHYSIKTFENMQKEKKTTFHFYKNLNEL
jgi:hypothetical protein